MLTKVHITLTDRKTTSIWIGNVVLLTIRPIWIAMHWNRQHVWKQCHKTKQLTGYVWPTVKQTILPVIYNSLAYDTNLNRVFIRKVHDFSSDI